MIDFEKLADEAERGYCVAGGKAGEPHWFLCGRPNTHVAVVSPTGLMPNGYVYDACEEHARERANSEIEWGEARAVYFMSIDELLARTSEEL